MKKRFSLSIEEKLMKRVDGSIDGIITRSRSDAVEKILRKYFTDVRSVLVLAGGKPEKLFVKELNVYRPLVEIGKRKLIEDIVIKCREAGFIDITIVGFASVISKLYEVLGDGEKYNVSITYVEESQELGSAKTLELAKKHLETDFLFLPCDHWFDFDLKKLYDFHVMHNGLVTLAIHARTSFDWKTSIVVLDGYRIVEYEEYPKKPKTHLISAFIGVMKKDIFNYIPPGELNWSLQENLFSKLASEGKLIGYPIAGNWINVHTKQDVEKIIKMKSS